MVSVGEGLADDSVGAGAGAADDDEGAADELGAGSGVDEQAPRAPTARAATTARRSVCTPRPYGEFSEKAVTDGLRDRADTPFPASSQSSPWYATTPSLTLET